MSPSRRTLEAALLTDIVLLIFRVSGQLLASGDRLVANLSLTSARWQMLGAIALSDSARTAPQLAARMGMTRQGAQKQLSLLLKAGLVEAQANPGHARSPMYTLTRKGASIYAATERVQAKWANQLARDMTASGLKTTKQMLETLSRRLNDPPGRGSNADHR
jgi:DNA-binding MarR family transcriptional regulator